jgi:hypothetical protein
VTLPVVDLLEVVDVKDDQRDLAAEPQRPRDLALQRLGHIAAVPETGQRIGDRLSLNSLVEAGQRPGEH